MNDPRRYLIFLLLILLLAALIAPAAIAAGLYRDGVKPHWQADSQAFWYETILPQDAHRFIWVDTGSGQRRPAFNHLNVAEQISQLQDTRIDPDHLPFNSLIFADDQSTVDLLGAETSWRLNLNTGILATLDSTAGATGLPFSRTLRLATHAGAETHVTFVNRLEETITIWWVDGSGGRHQYSTLAEGQRHRQHTFSGHIWLALGQSGNLLALFEAADHEDLAVIDGREPDSAPEPAPPSMPTMAAVPAPDGSRAVFVRDDNLWLRDLQTGTESQLSLDGSANDSYRKDGQRPPLVEMEYDFSAPADSVPDVFWSPDSRHLIALRTVHVRERLVHMINSAPDNQLQPRLESYPYLKPGDDVPVGRPHLFDVETGQQIALDGTLFATPWSIDNFHWTSDGDRFFFLYNQRGHQVMRVIGVEAATGKTTTVVEEICETFFDYQGKIFLQHLDASDELVWMSERDGWNHLYLYDRKRGKVKKRITEGPWVVRAVEEIDTESRQVTLQAMGLVEGQDPYLIHFARVGLDGKNFTRLTDGDGTHRLDWAPDGSTFIDQWSRVDLPPVHVLRDGKTGSLICELETADATEILASGHRFPEPFVAVGRDGQTPIHGIIHRPLGFDPEKSYPVLEYIYAGPHGQHVPKSFHAQYHLQSLVDRGFIVVQIDGMGTNWRHKAFHDVCWQNLVDGGFPDRIAWLKAVAAHEPAMDLTRVGILGGSAGGQNALAALLTHGDFYKAGMADCGCHDNRMDKIWWNEQWMGYPIGPHYAANSNVTLAKNLEGALLLVVGELDRNVDPASTMQVVDALVKADKDFDLLVIPGAGHGASGTPYGWRRTIDFFVRHFQP